MGKAVLISIRPKWVEKIASGEKTVEVRKTAPKIQTPFKCYIYQSGKKLKKAVYGSEFSKNGYVIGEFLCVNIEDFRKWEHEYFQLLIHLDPYAGTNGDYKFLNDYLGGKKKGYGLYIVDVKIYEVPKDITDFTYFKKCKACKNGIKEILTNCDFFCENCEYPVSLERPPQSWCYVEDLGGEND